METAKDIIDRLALRPHPEGGWYAETWRADATGGARANGTAIYYLLEQGVRSKWHRVNAAEIWHFYAGAPLKLSIAAEDGAPRDEMLGTNLRAGERPQIIIPPHRWQAAESLGAWTLVGCTVSPGFMFEHFEMAPPGWEPDGA